MPHEQVHQRSLSSLAPQSAKRGKQRDGKTITNNMNIIEKIAQRFCGCNKTKRAKNNFLNGQLSMIATIKEERDHFGKWTGNWSNVDDRIDIIKSIAAYQNYQMICHQEANKLLSFRRWGVRVNVYYTKMTVGTCMDHPSKGKTQLFRRNVTRNQLIEIMGNPRTHTGKGYYKK